MTQKRLTSFFTINHSGSSSADQTISVQPSGSDDESSVHVNSGCRNETDVEQHELELCEESVLCECSCCTDVAVPYHPLHLSESTTSHCSQRQGKLIRYSRRIQPGWYSKYPWISVCTTKYNIFCSVCHHAKSSICWCLVNHHKNIH